MRNVKCSGGLTEIITRLLAGDTRLNKQIEQTIKSLLPALRPSKSGACGVRQEKSGVDMKLEVVLYDIEKNELVCKNETGELVKCDPFVSSAWPWRRAKELEGKHIEFEDIPPTHGIYGSACYIPMEINVLV